MTAADGYWVFDSVNRDHAGRNDVSTTWNDVSDTALAGKTTWLWPNMGCRQTIVCTFSWSGIPQIMLPVKEYNVTVRLEQITNNKDCLSVGSGINIYPGRLDNFSDINSMSGVGYGPKVHFGTGDGLVGENTAAIAFGYHQAADPSPYSAILIQCGMYQDYYRVQYRYRWVEGNVPNVIDGHHDGGTGNNIKIPQLGNRIKVNEIGQYFGEWTRIEGTDTFNAVWNGQITDVIEVQSIEGNQVTLYRQGNGGYYYGTLNGDGTITGTASWYKPGWTWSGTILSDSANAGFDPNARPILSDSQDQGFMSDVKKGESI